MVGYWKMIIKLIYKNNNEFACLLYMGVCPGLLDDNELSKDKLSKIIFNYIVRYHIILDFLHSAIKGELTEDDQDIVFYEDFETDTEEYRKNGGLNELREKYSYDDEVLESSPEYWDYINRLDDF